MLFWLDFGGGGGNYVILEFFRPRKIHCISFVGWKYIFFAYNFILVKTIGLGSLFQFTNRVLKICIGSRDIDKNVSEFEIPEQKFIFWHILTYISGSLAFMNAVVTMAQYS